MAAIALLVSLQVIKLLLIGLVLRTSLSLGGIIVLSFADLLSVLLNVYLVSILVQAILSWVSPGTYHPLFRLLHQLNEPLLGPARRIIPPICGLDLSPLVVLIGIQLMKMLVVAPLTDMGWALAGR